MSKKSCSFLYCEYAMKIGQNLLNILLTAEKVTKLPGSSFFFLDSDADLVSISGSGLKIPIFTKIGIWIRRIQWFCISATELWIRTRFLKKSRIWIWSEHLDLNLKSRFVLYRHLPTRDLLKKITDHYQFVKKSQIYSRYLY